MKKCTKTQTINFQDKLYNLFLKEEDKIKGYCKKCKRPIFNLNSRFGKKQLCVYCNDMFELGQKTKEDEIMITKYYN